MMYLDYAATTPPYEEVIDTVAEVMRTYYGNPSSLHHLGVEAERLLQQAKDVMSRILKVKPHELIMTSGGTESNNLAIKGAAYQYRGRGNHLITSQVEHPSVMESFKQLEQEGYRVTYLPVDETGCVNLEALSEALCEETILVSVMHVNNEVGRIQPIAQIGQMLAKWPKVLFHVDSVQGVAKLPLAPRDLGIDLLSASAHKFRGPKGVGFLYRRENLKLVPLIVGGGQEAGMRSGTENLPLIIGMTKALRLATEHLEQAIAHKYRLRRIITDGIASIPELQLSGSMNTEEMAPHIVHFCFPGMKAEVVVHAMEEHGICISTKSACSSDELKPSNVLLAMGYDRDRASSGLRLSFSEDHTEEDMHKCVKALEQVVQVLKPAARIKGER
jgi:cysteine desulfurase